MSNSEEEDELIVWDQTRGTFDTARIAPESVMTWKHGEKARIEGPYGERMGFFSLDDLRRTGKVESQGVTLLSPERWEKDREKLISAHTNLKITVFGAGADVQDRALLGLPRVGVLFKEEIKLKFRAASKAAHPDRGGSPDRFIKLGEARDRLLKEAR